MALTLAGKIKTVLPLEIGEGKNGQWKKQFFVLNFMDGNYPKGVCFSAWGDKTDVLRLLSVGSEVLVSFNLESREYQGRWYTDAKVWKIEVKSGGAEEESHKAKIEPIGEESSDLPF